MNPLRLVACCGLLCVGSSYAQFAGQKTYCNPIDINYQYNFEQILRGISFRSGADPVIVNHHGDYYLSGVVSNPRHAPAQ